MESTGFCIYGAIPPRLVVQYPVMYRGVINVLRSKSNHWSPQVIRLFGVASLWELAMSLAASFMGSWFWHIHTKPLHIIIYYLLLFLIMTLVFAWAAKKTRRVPIHIMMRLGIVIAMAYLTMTVVLGTTVRSLYLVLGALTGLSSGFYWLSLYMAAAFWIPSGQAEWYNASIGVVENVFAIAAPPLSGWIILSLHQTQGYRVIFAIAAGLLSIAGIVSPKPNTVIDYNALSSTPKDNTSPWRQVLQGMTMMGFRDGVLYIIPGLYLYIMTQNPVDLGFYFTMEGVLQIIAFYGLSHWVGLQHVPVIRRIGLVLSVISGSFLFILPKTPGLFIFGGLVALTYPIYKIALEARALELIQQTTPEQAERNRLTSTKEFWLNLGRLMSFIILAVLLVFVHLPLLNWLPLLLAAWPLTTMMVYLRLPPPTIESTP